MRKVTQQGQATKDFVARALAYAKAAELKASTVSNYLLNDGKALDRLAAGGDMMTGQIEAAIKKLEGFERELKRTKAAAKAAPARKRA